MDGRQGQDRPKPAQGPWPGAGSSSSSSSSPPSSGGLLGLVGKILVTGAVALAAGMAVGAVADAVSEQQQQGAGGSGSTARRPPPAPKEPEPVVDDAPDDPVNDEPAAPGEECVVCLCNARSHVLIPCGHMAVCGGCAGEVRRGRMGTCPVCRAPLTGGRVMRVFK